MRRNRRRSPRFSILICVFVLACSFGTLVESDGGAAPSGVRQGEGPAPYYPGPSEDWERRTPEEVGMSSELLEKALATAKGYAAQVPKDPAEMIRGRIANEKHNEIVGPTKERGDLNGVVLRHGYIVSELGDTKRVDMTFSVSKSFLSTVAALAVDRGLIRSVHDPVKDYVDDRGFDTPNNARITWHHFLQQTSEWEGTLWGKPHWIEEEPGHELREPGTFLEHNDVRVNRLALSLLRVWKRPLPEVIKEQVMDPIGATDAWQWHGYRNSEVKIEGKKMVCVSGGGHWGGGVWMSSRDLARFGHLFLRRGKWKDRQLISEKWMDMARTPCPVYPEYGYMWWLNTDKKLWPHAPESSFAARGAGSSMIWVDPEHDLVLVLRWFDWEKGDEILKDLIAAVKETT